MARRFDPLIEAVIDVIAERVPDFDPEVIADLIEVVADDIWISALGPAVDQVMDRIGLGAHVESSEPDPNVTLPGESNLAGNPSLASGGVIVSKSSHAVTGMPKGNLAVVACTCPHCQEVFYTTLQQIANHQSDKCPHCEKEIVPEPEPGPNEGGP